MEMPLLRTITRFIGLGPTDSQIRRFLLEMLPKQSVGAEIGVHEGEFSRSILQIVEPRELHLIDPWHHETGETYKHAWYGGRAKAGQLEMNRRYELVRQQMEADVRAGHVIIHRGYSADVLAGFPIDFFDWVYIDGNHLYEFVKRDLELSLSRTKRGGLIAGDDYTAGGWWHGGVKRAVDELAASPQLRLLAIRDRQFLIRNDA